MIRARAVVYVSQPSLRDVETRRCLRHLEANAYDLAGIIVADESGAHWRDAFAVVGNDLADVIVVSDRCHLDDRPLPRLEVAGEQRGPAANSTRRRPRRL